jgi:hypothetical protein
MNMQEEEKYSTSPWITLAILSGLGIIAMSAETMVKKESSKVHLLTSQLFQLYYNWSIVS